MTYAAIPSKGRYTVSTAFADYTVDMDKMTFHWPASEGWYWDPDEDRTEIRFASIAAWVGRNLRINLSNLGATGESYLDLPVVEISAAS